MVTSPTRSYHGIRVCLLAACLALACGPELPDDLDALMALMNDNDMTLSVNSTNKVQKLHGKDGLLHVLRRGKPVAQGKAAMRLRQYPGSDVEEALIAAAASKSSEDYLRAQALCSLAVVGTPRALPVVKNALHWDERRVASCAAEAEKRIRGRYHPDLP